MSDPFHKMVSVTATFSIPLKIQIEKAAKLQKKTLTELIRPWLVEAADIRSPGMGENLPDGTPRMAITVRIPSDVKEAFGRVAESHGTTVSGIVAAIIVEAMKKQVEAVD